MLHLTPEATLNPTRFQFTPKPVIGNVVVVQVCWEVFQTRVLLLQLLPPSSPPPAPLLVFASNMQLTLQLFSHICKQYKNVHKASSSLTLARWINSGYKSNVNKGSDSCNKSSSSKIKQQTETHTHTYVHTHSTNA